MAGIKVATGELCDSKKPSKAKVTLRRIIMWWIINPAALVLLYFAMFQGIEWCQNLIKFIVWANFILWMIILLSGDKGQKSLRNKGFPVSATTNGTYGLVFVAVLACFGWFGYAGMELLTLVSQQITYFGDAT